jgi:ribosomal protein L11 methyltransferase
MSESSASASEARAVNGLGASPRFVAVRAQARGEGAERAVAEAWAAGATGFEEREGPRELIAYALAERGEAVRAALVEALGAAAVGRVEAVPAANWSEAWKDGLRAIVVSPRLVVRPPFAPRALAPGQRELVIDPRQAFGTGAHASTALALEGLDAALAQGGGGSVLDVGCGSGILALAALALGAEQAVACDLDPIAAREAAENARANGLASGLLAFAGSLDALAPRGFDLVLANLLRRELVALLPALTAVTRPGGGALVLSGLLAHERAEVEAALGGAGARVVGARERADERGDRWLALIARR